jgi:hypothetical protein
MRRGLPATSVYHNEVGAVGLVEPASENIAACLSAVW